MFSAYPRSGEINADAYLAMIELGCRKLSDEAIQQTVEAVATGELIGMRAGWAPAPDVFHAHAKLLHERNELVRQRLARPALPKPTYEPSTTIKQEGTEAERKARVAAIMSKFRKEDA